MTTLLHQIVAGIPDPDDSPVVLFDFDEWFALAPGTDISPPDVRSSSTWTQLNDGEDWGASTLGDRVLTLRLTAFEGNAEDQAEALQTLGRLLDDSRGQWLLWQDEGTVNERYFKTKRASMSIEDLILEEEPKRIITVRIPAEPKARGRRITGTFTVDNDPTAGTNPMSYVFPPIKGDVAVPVVLRTSGASNASGCMLAISASEDAPSTPIFKQTGTGFTVAGWNNNTTVSDSDSIGGTVTAMQKTSGALTNPTTYVLDDVPLGDYRLVARVKTSTAGVTVSVKHVSALRSNLAATVPNDGQWHWVDLDVLRMPISAPMGELPGFAELGPIDCSLTLTAAITGATGLLLVDAVKAVPAGLDNAQNTHLLIAAGTGPDYSGMFTIADVNFDSLADNLWQGDATQYIPVPYDGSLPELTPGIKNVMSFIRVVSQQANYYDQIDVPTDFEYLYYPEYLYIQSATG